MYGLLLDLPLDIPQSEVEGAEGVCLFTARWIEESPLHVLPQALGVLWIPADQAAGTLLKHVSRPALADTGDARVRLDSHHHVALVEQRIRIGRLIGAHAGDLHLRDG